MSTVSVTAVKCGSFFFCIYHRQSLFNVLLNCHFVMNLLLEWAASSESLLFKDHYFFIHFRKGYFSKRCCFRLLTSFSQLDFLFIIYESAILIPEFLNSNYPRVDRVVCSLRAALNRSIYQKMQNNSFVEAFNKNINFAIEFQYQIS